MANTLYTQIMIHNLDILNSDHEIM